MSSIFEGLSVHLEFAKILLIVSFVFAIITIIIHLIFRNNKKYRLIKYIPGLILLIMGLFGFIGIDLNSTVLSQHNEILIMTMEFVGGLVSILAGLIIEIIVK